MSRRRAGSVRFDPYAKVQWYDETSMAWRDVQQSFPTPEQAEAEAEALIPADATTWRLMHVYEGGRTPGSPRARSAPCQSQ